MDKRGIRGVRALMDVARDGDRSIVERVVALDSAYFAVIDVAESETDIDEVIAAAGIDRRSFLAWSMSEAALVGGANRRNGEMIIRGKSMGVAMELFPSVAHGGGAMTREQANQAA